MRTVCCHKSLRPLITSSAPAVTIFAYLYGTLWSTAYNIDGCIFIIELIMDIDTLHGARCILAQGRFGCPPGSVWLSRRLSSQGRFRCPPGSVWLSPRVGLAVPQDRFGWLVGWLVAHGHLPTYPLEPRTYPSGPQA